VTEKSAGRGEGRKLATPEKFNDEHRQRVITA
jgi:hypothetical protein